MSPSHVATLAALASAVTALKKSKSKDAKAILVDLEENHDDAMGSAIFYSTISEMYADRIPEGMSAEAWVTAANVMGVDGDALAAGAEPCIIEGRYAVRTKDGLKLGPRV